MLKMLWSLAGPGTESPPVEHITALRPAYSTTLCCITMCIFASGQQQAYRVRGAYLQSILKQDMSWHDTGKHVLPCCIDIDKSITILRIFYHCHCRWVDWQDYTCEFHLSASVSAWFCFTHHFAFILHRA